MKESGRIRELDGIRGFAILSVVIFHYLMVGDIDSWGRSRWLAPAWILWSGVDLFFVLSGFLIGGILLDQRGSTNYFSVFYLRRSLRIFPLYYLILILSLTLAGINSIRNIPSGDFLFDNDLSHWWYVVFQQNHYEFFRGRQPTSTAFLGPSWSLAIEEHFYLVLPFLVRFTPRRWIPYVCLLGIVAAPLARLQVDGWGGYFYTWCRMDALFVGAFLAFVIREKPLRALARDRVGWLYAAVAVLVFSAAWRASSDTWLPGVGVGSVVGHTCLAMFFGLIVLICVVRPESRLAAFFRLRFLRSLGMVSYGMYLMHLPVLGFVHGLVLRQSPQLRSGVDVGCNLASAFLCWGIAYASYRLFEGRLIAYGRRFSYRAGPRMGGDRERSPDEKKGNAG